MGKNRGDTVLDRVDCDLRGELPMKSRGLDMSMWW